MTRAFGIDISKHQASADGKKLMNFAAVRDHKEKISFIASRAGISWGYQDPQFHYHWSQSGLLKVGRIAYHVIYFGESAIAQMDSLFKMLEKQSDFAHDRIALDLEVEGINTRSRITTTTNNCLEICKSRTGRYPIVYSRASWVNSYLAVGDMPKINWWLATYRKPSPSPFYTSEHPGPPLLPKGVSTYLIHQTGDKNRSIGAQSHYMDYNRFNGDLQAVQKFFNNPQDTVIDPPKDEALFKVKCMVNSLRKRSGPGSNHSVIGHLYLGDVVSVYEERGSWLRIDPAASVWCSGASNYVFRMNEGDTIQHAQCIVSALFKREGPGKQHKIIGNLVRNDVVGICEEKIGWFRITADKNVWVCGFPQYMRLL